jgi:hypothetical protein
MKPDIPPVQGDFLPDSSGKPLPQKSNRLRFLLTGLSVVGLGMLALRFSKLWGRNKKPARFLTQDGRLVELDASQTQKEGRKISKTELQHWITK